MDEANVEVIAGINLPILVKLAGLRGEVPLDEAVILAREAGRNTLKSQAKSYPANSEQRARAEPNSTTASARGGRDVVNRKGLHARASAKFVELAEVYEAEVTVTRDGQTVGGNPSWAS